MYVALVPETTDSDLSLHVEGSTVVYRIYVVIGTVVYRSAEKITYEPGKFNFRFDEQPSVSKNAEK